MKADLPQLILVEWADAYAYHDQYTKEELEEKPLCSIFFSIGFLPLSGDSGVKLVSDVEVDDNGKVIGYRGINVIPRECVLSMEKVVAGEVSSDT